MSNAILGGGRAIHLKHLLLTFGSFPQETMNQKQSLKPPPSISLSYPPLEKAKPSPFKTQN